MGILPLLRCGGHVKLRIGGLRQKKAPTGAGAALVAGCVDVLRLVWYSRVKSGDHLDETDHFSDENPFGSGQPTSDENPFERGS